MYATVFNTIGQDRGDLTKFFLATHVYGSENMVNALTSSLFSEKIGELIWSFIDFKHVIPSINFTTPKSGQTFLHYAVLKNRNDIIDFLLQSPEIDLNIIDKNGHFPLSIACGKNNQVAAKKLINHGANLNQTVRGNMFFDFLFLQIKLRSQLALFFFFCTHRFFIFFA